MKPAILSLSILAANSLSLHAGPRTSASYSILTDTSDSGGKRTASSTYTNDGSIGSIGGIAGISTVIAPAETVKHGCIGQLYDLTSSISLSATPATKS